MAITCMFYYHTAGFVMFSVDHPEAPEPQKVNEDLTHYITVDAVAKAFYELQLFIFCTWYNFM